MKTSALRFIRPAMLAACAALVLCTTSAGAQDDPPPEAGRISLVSGTVSIQPAGTNDWGQAYQNLTVAPGDRIYTDQDGRAEIQIGQTYVRIAPGTDVTLVEDTPFTMNFGVAQGSVRLHSFALWPRQLLDISTPNGNAEFGQSGDLRVDVYSQDGATVFTNLGEFADITAAGEFRQQLDNGQSLQISGTNPVYPQWLQPAPPDDLDAWSQQLDGQIANAAAYQYVSPDVPGAADLDAYGGWEPDTDYGPMWFPRNVDAGWVPYHYGHWVNRDPWGWVWVEDEPWGYAPFHYGRWVVYRGRWGWVPGPPTVRPVWSPALVVFAGGVQAGGAALSVWVPLGPGEAYVPWYRCSPRYIDRVNITNIRASRVVHVQKTYVNINITNVTYVNRSHGYTAMRRDDFAGGRSPRNVAVRVDAQEVNRARPIDRPVAEPTQRSFISRPVARPARVAEQRPMLINQQGREMQARPGATPVQAPVRPLKDVQPLPGRRVVAAPAHVVPNGPANRPLMPNQGRQDENRQQPRDNGGRPNPMPVQPSQPNFRPLQPQPPRQNGNPAVNPNANQNQTPPRFNGGRPDAMPQTPPQTPPQRQNNPFQKEQQDREQRNGAFPGGRPAPMPQPAQPPQAAPNNIRQDYAPPQSDRNRDNPGPPQQRPNGSELHPTPQPQRPQARPDQQRPRDDRSQRSDDKDKKQRDDKKEDKKEDKKH